MPGIRGRDVVPAQDRVLSGTDRDLHPARVTAPMATPEDIIIEMAVLGEGGDFAWNSRFVDAASLKDMTAARRGCRQDSCVLD